MMYAMPVATETATTVPAANPQISVFVYASIRSLPLAASLQSKPPPARIVPLGACGEPIGPCYTPAAQMAAATAVKVSPMMNTAISNRVIGQMLRIAPQLLDFVGPALARKYWRLEGSFWTTS